MKKAIITFFAAVFVFNSCKKNNQETPPVEDNLTPSELQLITDAGIDTNTTFSDVLFADGSRMKEWDSINNPGFVLHFTKQASILTENKKALLIELMIQAGIELTHKDPPNSQKKLAYVYGSKIINSPNQASAGSKCKERLYGLDCSGMIYQMAISSNLAIDNDNVRPENKGTEYFSKISNWNLALAASPDYKELEMVNLGQLDVNKLEPGDIVVKAGHHMGMVLSSNNQGRVLNSAGSPDYTCLQNQDLSRGPIISKDFQKWLDAFKIGTGYSVLRLVIPKLVIGSQIWESSNLDVSKYRNGDLIPQVTNPAQWGNLTTGAWCYYNSSTINGAIYGKLYNWYAVTDPRGLAPLGWHIPNDVEWSTLTNYLGSQTVAGGKLKESGTTHWLSPNVGATNTSSFTALPGGYRVNTYAAYGYLGTYGVFWSSDVSPYTSTQGSCRYLDKDNAIITWTSGEKSNGFSVRCVKD